MMDGISTHPPTQPRSLPSVVRAALHLGRRAGRDGALAVDLLELVVGGEAQLQRERARGLVPAREELALALVHRPVRDLERDRLVRVGRKQHVPNNMKEQ